MTIANIVTMGLILGIGSLGLLFVWIFRHEPRKAITVFVLSLGFALLSYGHVQWAARRESPEVKQHMFIRHVSAGWALVVTGFALSCRCKLKQKNAP